MNVHNSVLPSAPACLPACPCLCFPQPLPACLPALACASLSLCLPACLPLPACRSVAVAVRPGCPSAAPSAPACLPALLCLCFPLSPCLPACTCLCLPQHLPACLPARACVQERGRSRAAWVSCCGAPDQAAALDVHVHVALAALVAATEHWGQGSAAVKPLIQAALEVRPALCRGGVVGLQREGSLRFCVLGGGIFRVHGFSLLAFRV